MAASAPTMRDVVARQDAGGAERLGPRHAAGDVVLEERAVETKRDAEVERRRIGGGFEAAVPERRHEHTIIHDVSHLFLWGQCPAAMVSNRLTSALAPRASRADHQDRIVAGQRPDHLGQVRAVDGDPENLGLTGPGTQQHQLLHAVGPPSGILTGLAGAWRRRFVPLEPCPLADGCRRRLVGPVGAALHELQLADVARQGGLRNVEAGRAQPAAQLLLVAHGLVLDGVENGGLALRLHGCAVTAAADAARTTSIHEMLD
jgi:hypothetical protein